eukprot:2193184-Rhodomonas_salina.1
MAPNVQYNLDQECCLFLLLVPQSSVGAGRDSGGAGGRGGKGRPWHKGTQWYRRAKEYTNEIEFLSPPALATKGGART